MLEKIGVGALMEKLRKTCVLDYKYSKRNYGLVNISALTKM